MKAKARLRICTVAALFTFAAFTSPAQRSAWRQATAAELASVLPSRASVESEHIETEMRTASGIVDDRGHFVAGVVLLTAGYSADGKYSHLLVTQVPLRIAGMTLAPGHYVFGWTRNGDSDVLTVHFNLASTGVKLGEAEAHRIPDSLRLESLRIWPPEEHAIIQIGRFGIPYKIAGE